MFICYLEEIIFSILFIAVIILCLIYYIQQPVYGYWNEKGIVQVKPFPFFGTESSVMLFKSSIAENAKKQYDAFPNEKFIGTYQGKQPVLLIRDPELLKLVMSKDFFYFNSRSLTPDKGNILLSNIFHSEGDAWRVFRKNLTPLFSSAKLRNMFHLIEDQGNNFEEYIRRRIKKSNNQEFRDLMSRFTINVIGSCVFGLEINAMTENQNPFQQIARKITELTYKKSIKRYLIQIFPVLAKIIKVEVFGPKVINFFVSLIKKIVKSRNQTESNRNDFIDLMMDMRRRGYITGEKINSLITETDETVSIKVDDGIMAAQSFIFFAAGFETSASTMSFALYELAMNQSIQKRAQREIDEMFINTGGKLNYEAVSKLHYLDLVISETLRKYPILGVITRKCTENYTIPNSDIVIEKGITVNIPVLGLHYDEKYFPNPENFDPDRFLSDKKSDRNQYAYMPFGEGMRICIGLRFGKIQVMVGLITVLKSFCVLPCSLTEAKIIFDSRGILTTPKNGIHLRITARETKK